MGPSHFNRSEETQVKATIRKTLIATLFAAPFAVFAQTATTAPAKDPLATPGIDKRQANQERRIDQGVRSGELTQKEAAKLDKGQEHVQKMEDKAKADGSVSAKERKRIQHAQDSQSKKIYREKHDRQQDRDHDGKNDHKRRGAKH